jgi:hypothetical protein
MSILYGDASIFTKVLGEWKVFEWPAFHEDGRASSTRVIGRRDGEGAT